MPSSLRTPAVILFIPLVGAAFAQTPICAVQGPGLDSPYDGQTITIQGVVTAVYTGSGSVGGYFLEQPDCDAAANTSNGIFVYDTSPTGISAGQIVRVVGLVQEFNGVTEIIPSSATVMGTGTVDATSISLPHTSYSQWERYEGMYLRFPATLTVTSNEDWLEYGQLVLSTQRMITPTQAIDPNDVVASGTTSTGTGNAAAIDAEYALLGRSYVLLDDGRTNSFPTPLPLVGSEGTLRTGSTVTGLTGVLHYSFGDYRVHPVGTVPLVHQPRPPVPAVGGTLRAASLNVLNYWTTLGEWGAQNAGELTRQRTKLLAALQALDADVFALHELENNDVAWIDLLASLNTAVGAGTYAGREENAFGNGGTKSVIFYKTEVLTPWGPLDALNSGPFQRPHLTQAFTVNATGAQFLFSTVHMRSKLCDNATGDDLDQGDGQGCFNGNRRDQANALVDHWEAFRTSTGIAAQLIMGDFNSYGEEDPMDILRASGLVQLITTNSYSYFYGSLFGALDHAFGTLALADGMTGASVWHINSDEPEALDYSDANVARYQPNAFRCSDHDPLLVGLDAYQLVTAVHSVSPHQEVTFHLVNNMAQWSFGTLEGTPLHLELYDARGSLVWQAKERRSPIVHLTTGLCSGVYAWRITGQDLTGPTATGRFTLP